MGHRAVKSQTVKDYIRITLGQGNRLWNFCEMREMTAEGFDHLMADGIRYFRDGYLFLPIADQLGRPVTRLGPRRHRLEDITIREPYKSAADEYRIS